VGNTPDKGIRPDRSPVIGHLDGEIDDAEFGQRPSRAQASRRKFLHTLGHRSCDVHGFRRQKQRGVARLAQIRGNGARREQAAQTGRQSGGIHCSQSLTESSARLPLVCGMDDNGQCKMSS